MTTHFHDSFDDLPDRHHRLLGAAGNFDLGLSWFRNLAATCLDPGDELVLVACDVDDTAAAVLPLCRRASPRFLSGARELTALSNFYTCRFAPGLAEGEDPQRLCRLLADGLRAHPDGVDIVNLDSIARDDPLFDTLAEQFSAAGFFTQPYFHFGNWHEPVAGVTFDDYMAGRDAALRNTLRRKHRKLERDFAVDLRIVTQPDDVDAAMDSYDAVYAASWKEPEPYPDFTRGLAHAAAAVGALRLGLCFLDGAPAAAQLWLVAGGQATIFKLAHDERFGKTSVGTVLTAEMARHTLEVDRVAEIDFGRGDDSYKQLWLGQRREMWGLLAFNPATPRGLLAAARHGLLPRLKRLLRPGH
ncbi:MAG: GNAT family N-acetyltransferase [Minwuiales bacterium]|nr:GNAT family N-acetyltransferase [Minwuiales bacterium]